MNVFELLLKNYRFLGTIYRYFFVLLQSLQILYQTFSLALFCDSNKHHFAAWNHFFRIGHVNIQIFVVEHYVLCVPFEECAVLVIGGCSGFFLVDSE